ncbi:hypothetical protein CEE36_02720 [candidate division TA06 bacterium B3_TA06]|uniref:Uncharacterized protein n=1 Tax=candidate division TA06 bacterium B3_TA06 TaxID=2012487 RepID=A0A532V8Z4_UNCT6|nr:MAG: hypothetical protein CEE36_02720 [candidate division TA06 bacterium B3_TA06]
MSDVSKGDRVREWLKVFVPIITAVLVVGGGGRVSIRVANNIQRKVQERSNDIEVAHMVIDVLVAKDMSLYAWLPDLIGTISDSLLQDVMAKGVKADTTVPDTIREAVQERLLEVSVDSERLGVQIMYMKGDSVSMDRARKAKEFLVAKGFQCFITPASHEWYYVRWGRPETPVAEIRHSKSELDFAKRVKGKLDTHSDLGEFKLKKIGGSMSPTSISIVLPDKTK